MKEYIEREAFIEAKRKQYCADCDRRKGMKNGKMRFCYEIGEAPCRACYVDDLLTDVEDAPTADVVEVRWLPVVGYEGLYEVSNFGDVRCSDGTPVRQSVNHKKNTDYKCVWLKKNGVGKTVYVHRLVAEAFIPNPNNFPVVNHMDEDGTNNRSDNLEWCTLQYNTTYGTAIERRVAKVRGRKMPEKQKRDISASVKRYQNSEAGLGKRVVCLETGEEFTSIRAAAEHFGLNPSTVGMCCLRGTNGRKYTFRYCNKMDGGVNDDKAD